MRGNGRSPGRVARQTGRPRSKQRGPACSMDSMSQASTWRPTWPCVSATPDRDRPSCSSTATHKTACAGIAWRPHSRTAIAWWYPICGLWPLEHATRTTPTTPPYSSARWRTTSLRSWPLGHDRFAVVGHDRRWPCGVSVGPLDHPGGWNGCVPSTSSPPSNSSSCWRRAGGPPCSASTGTSSPRRRCPKP